MSFLIVYLTRLLSSLVGVVANLRLPSPVNSLIIRQFVKSYKVNVEEISERPESFKSLGDFFLRSLKIEARPILNLDSEFIASPVDGVLRSRGKISDGSTVLVKGLSFDWNTFIIQPELAKEFQTATFFNFYLSPRDYHHVHFPIAGKVKEFIHHPGGLLPVNDWSTNTFPNLFCFNERVVAVIEGTSFRYLIIMIGALNVGSIELAFDPTFKRPFFATKETHKLVEQEKPFNSGDRFGSFRLGSSVVCVFPQHVISELSLGDGTAVTYGSKIAGISS